MSLSIEAIEKPLKNAASLNFYEGFSLIPEAKKKIFIINKKIFSQEKIILLSNLSKQENVVL